MKWHVKSPSTENMTSQSCTLTVMTDNEMTEINRVITMRGL